MSRRGPVAAAGMAVVAVLALLTACGGPEPRQAPVPHDAADVAFARDMTPHHQQAVVLAAMVPAHTGDPAVRSIATQIGADQQAEIRTLHDLLATWSEPADAASGGMAMSGMVDRATMDRLASLYDEAFDTLWVTSMIGHHRGAIAMAQDEIAHGQSHDAVHVATMIVAAQQREISIMTHLISASE